MITNLKYLNLNINVSIQQQQKTDLNITFYN